MRIPLLLLLCLLLPLYVFGQVADPDKVFDRLMHQGDSLQKKGQYELAIRKYNSALLVHKKRGEEAQKRLQEMFVYLNGLKQQAEKAQRQAEAALKEAKIAKQQAEAAKVQAENALAEVKAANLRNHQLLLENTLKAFDEGKYEEARGFYVRMLDSMVDSLTKRQAIEQAGQWIWNAPHLMPAQLLTESWTQQAKYRILPDTAKTRLALATCVALYQYEQANAIIPLIGLSEELDELEKGNSPQEILSRLAEIFGDSLYLHPLLAKIPAGRFDMGCTAGQGEDCEEELYKDIAVSTFYLSRYEVTQAEYEAVMGKNHAYFKDCSTCPIEAVSWYDAVLYCNKRSEAEGFAPYYAIDSLKKDPNNTSEYDKIKWTVTLQPQANGYRLPTEVEWEYAARAGQDYKYSGSDSLQAVGWYNENSQNKTHGVGGRQANAWGIYDMSGNVWEWCENWYAEKLEVEENGLISPSEGSYRANRGGSSDYDAWYSSVSSRIRNYAGNRDYFIGLRLARRP